MTDHISAKHKIKAIASKQEFVKLLDDALLDDTERKILQLVYAEHKTLGYAADVLGYSYSMIKIKHRCAVQKIEQIIKRRS